MARSRHNRNAFSRTLAASLASVLLAGCTAAAPNAAATTYSFRPARAENGAVLFVITSVRPASVRSAQIRVGHLRPHRLDLTTARRAVRRGRLRLRVGPIVAGSGGGAGKRLRLARRTDRLKIVADTTPPETTITSGPSGSVSSRSASFSFSSSERHGGFQCSFDSGTWEGCDSPLSYSQLASGAHTFSARAYDGAGNVDPTPATRTWTVSPPDPAPTEPEPAPEPIPAPPEPLPPGALMYDGFNSPNGPNNLITNEYAAWHSWDEVAVDSPFWKSDGGSLFSVPAIGPDGASARVAYDGPLDNEQADRYSEAHTHSDKLRFFSKAGGFGDVRVGTWIEPLGWGAGAPTSWGGFKLYLRREKDASVSSAYTAEPYIYDGHAYIQKKCEGATGGGTYANGGTYYLLASKSGLSTPIGSWHKVEASAKTNLDGSVTISLYRDGALVLQTVDKGVRSDGTGCAPLIAGHLGFRSDFFQYYLENFTVSPLP